MLLFLLGGDVGLFHASKIFLFTSISYMPQWYSSKNRGWEFLSTDTYPKGDPKEHQITIMKKRLI